MKDEELALVEYLIPPSMRDWRRRRVGIRQVLNGLLYVLLTSCQWAAIPKELLPKTTVFDHFDLWNWDGTFARIHDALYMACREQAGRAQPEGGDHRQPERE